MLHTADEIFTLAGTEMTVDSLVTPLDCIIFRLTNGANLIIF